MMQQKAIRAKNSVGVLVVLAGLVTIGVVAIASRLDASAADPAFCSPSF
jgi:hypothetical protein